QGGLDFLRRDQSAAEGLDLPLIQKDDLDLGKQPAWLLQLGFNMPVSSHNWNPAPGQFDLAASLDDERCLGNVGACDSNVPPYGLCRLINPLAIVGCDDQFLSPASGQMDQR